jgi:hypothetical protein
MPTTPTVERARPTTRWLAVGLVVLLAACAAAPQAPVSVAPPPPRDVTPPVAAVTPAPIPQTPADLLVPPAPTVLETAPPPPVKQTLPGPPFDAGGSLSMEPGLYRCELDRRVVVRRIAPDGQSMVINWLGKDATLQAVRARTGALRFEGAQTGLVWIVIVGKSMLLDSRAGRTLANECRL